jgi:glycosyltransferase involved in cell wall biosynthesis
MKITVIVCTYNRCQDLARALYSISVSKLPDPVQWEVLVVDNNSNDQTHAVIEDLCRQYPDRFRYLFEPRQGLSLARNSGVREARGDILAFVDDDAIVEPTWLQNLTANLHDSQWAGAGGRILPQEGFRPPLWLNIGGPLDLGGSIVLFDLGDKAGELDRPPFGTNMAFHRCMFDQYGDFRADLGRSGKSLIGNEETEFSLRLMAAGERFWYAPSAVVYHPVPKQRLNKAYLRAWWFSHGRSLIRQTGKMPSVREIPKHCFRRLADTLRMLFVFNSRWFLYSQCRFYCETRVCLTAGEIVEILRLGRRKPPKSSSAPERDPTVGSSS